jgi:hypothetical protein
MAEGKGVSSQANLLIFVKLLVGGIVDIERKYKERKIKGNRWAWKKCIYGQRCDTPSTKAPINEILWTLAYHELHAH